VRNKGENLTRENIDRIVDQLASIGVQTVNLGGNEPIFTNGINPADTLLPYIIQSLDDAGIIVGLTTAGISLVELHKRSPESIRLLNDLDVSLDSPFADEHNKNRGASLYGMALKALRLCVDYELPHTIVMCGMTWNLSDRHIDALMELAREYQSFVRINFIKPTELQHVELLPEAKTFFRASERLLARSSVIEMGEPMLAAATSYARKGCPCGTTSFRIHSITPQGTVPVSPCVYMHDFKVGDLLVDDLADIIESSQFRAFRKRVANPDKVTGCDGCGYLEYCRGGCAARSYLHKMLQGGGRDLFAKDPYCLRDEKDAGNTPALTNTKIETAASKRLVHQDYLCTLIVKP
jgi:radical SAM protein with 4Fe4S-binding SPASM domain